MPRNWPTHTRKAETVAALAAGLHHPPTSGRPMELWVVRRPPFIAVVIPALDQFDRDHPINGEGVRRNGIVGARSWLSANLGCNNRHVYRILTEAHTIGLSSADAVLTTLGLEHTLTDGSIPVIPNPRMGRDRWLELAAIAGLEDPEHEYDNALAGYAPTHAL